jgi:hypothetical protein
MQLGTAKITRQGTLWSENNSWHVTWRNIGSCLQPLPRTFATEADALAFCRERGLQVKP